ncbi:hypothetical protein D3C71_1787580 [compost metagenome]
MGVQGPRPARQPENSGCLSRWPYSRIVSPLSLRVAGASKKMTGVRPGRRTTSSFRPETFCASTHCAASRTTRSMNAFFSQSASNAGLLAGTAM